MKAFRLLIALCTGVLIALPASSHAQEKVRIISHYDKCVAYPPAAVVVQKGGTIEFKAVDTDAIVLLPRHIFVYENNDPVDVLRIPRGKSQTVKVSSDKDLRGVYNYAVVCADGRFKSAEGFSGPIIIIE